MWEANTLHEGNRKTYLTNLYILRKIMMNRYYILRILPLIVFVFFGNISLSAQAEPPPKTPFTQMYLPVWEEAMEHCLDVANAMPDSLYTYKPTAVSKTFAEQMIHMATSSELLTKRYVQGMDVKPIRLDASTMTKGDIIKLMKNGFAYTTNVIHTIEQDQLDEMCIMFHSKNEVSRAFALFYVQDHLTNHRAKANLYVRMNGIEPPHYTW